MHCPRCDKNLSLDREVGWNTPLEEALMWLILVLFVSLFAVYMGINRWGAIVTGVLVIFLFKVGERYYHCGECGARFRYRWGVLVER